MSGLFDYGPAQKGGVFSSPTAEPFRVSYRENPSIGFQVNLIRSWDRAELPEPIMSASSGPKDYTRNHIWAIFDRYPGVARVLMVRGEFAQSTPFLLVTNAAGEVFDMAGKEVVIEPTPKLARRAAPVKGDR